MRCLARTDIPNGQHTGPASALPLRHTAQALRQVIDEARSTRQIVSYAVYDIPEIGEALRRALDRGVTLQLVIESPQEQVGHVAYDGLFAFGPAIRERARIYRWPLHQRPVDDSGRHGALQAKCAVADHRRPRCLALSFRLSIVPTGTSVLLCHTRVQRGAVS